MDLAANTNVTKPMQILDRMFRAEFRFIQSGGSDSDGIAEAFHPDIVVHEPDSLPYAGMWRGHEQLGQLFKEMHDAWSSMKVEDLRAAMDGDLLFMGGTLIATARHSGHEIRQPFAEMLKIKDGLVVEGLPFYYDTAAINIALGHGPMAGRTST